MKLAHLLVGAIAALGALQPIHAEARNVRANIVRVDQAGNYNAASAVQSGRDNSAQIRQRGDDNSASVAQTGDRNRACIYQRGDGLSTHVEQRGSDQRLTVYDTPNARLVSQGPLLFGRLAFRCD